MSEATPIRPGITAETDARRELEQTALEAIRVAAERGELMGMAIVAFSRNDKAYHSIRRAHVVATSSAPVSFIEAKAAALLLDSSINGAG